MMKKALLFFFLTIVILLPVIYYFNVSVDPPIEHIDFPDESNIHQINDSTFEYKGNWLKKNEFGIWELYIEGSAVDRGLAFGLLGKTLQKEKEEAFIHEINNRIPSDFYLNFLKYFVGWFNRDLDEYIPQEYKEEIYAASHYMPDEFDYVGPKYHRALNYHAAHDIGHALQNMNMVGCTSFAAWGDKSKDSSVIIGRNFDFYFGEDFAKDKILAFIKPDSGYAFASVTWAGFFGVVSGMNEKGLTITLNSAKSDIPTKAKTPVSIIARTIIQYASTIDEAYEIAQSMDAFVTETYLIGSASENRVALIEKSETTTALYTVDDDFMTITNHLQSDTFKNQELNLENKKEEVSVYRLQRLDQLLHQQKSLDIYQAASILRDQKGIDATDLGLANERCVNQLIAHHSVIFKPERQLIWLSSAPYCLGAYSAYSLSNIITDPLNALTHTNFIDSLTIDKDPFLATDGFDNYVSFNKTREQIMSYLFSGNELDLSETQIQDFINNNSESYLPYFYLGKYFMNKKDYHSAIQYFETGLEYQTARVSERLSMEEQIKLAKKELE